MVNLSKTKSFVTLKKTRQVHSSLRLPETEHGPHHLLKQKSDEWFNLRKTVKVTGSTAYNALGIDGLKSQKETFQCINNQKEKPAPTEQQQMAMKHGTENEIHALATLHSKVMPAFFPNLTYYEEGIHMITANNKNIIGVSPDGSIRRSENLSGVIEDIVYAVECKCSYSSYKFNTPVYYKIPTRYICQTMLEMRSMGCQECIFLCWTEESTTVFKLRLNQRLIALIINESVDVFYSENDKPPSKLSSRAKEIKELCKDISNSSTFIGEFPSVLGTLHTNELIIDQDNLPYQTFQTTTPTLKKDYCEKEMISTLVSASTVLKEACQLNRKKASEVIPIMLSTVDRISNPETGHAQPIGYFLRGYSVSTDVMRNIAEDFMQACFVNGIHVPVQTFDGQWINLVVRDQQGNPQTKLQLQDDVWKEVKRMPKKVIVREIRQLNKSKNVVSKLDGRTINVSGYTPRLPKTSYLIVSAQSEINSEASEVTDSTEIIGEVLDSVMTEDISGSEIIYKAVSIQNTQDQIEDQNQEISNEAEEEVAEQ
ncbi:uncharacterized protein [Mytilus edulis]|uniref:uncharacterized protein n=1 Tax=Mytilus edulis TaxID=6550 RepID=UPI0039F0D4F9